MNTIEHRLEKLTVMLRKAYREKENRPSGDQWQGEVMRRVRKLGPLLPRPDPLVAFGQFVWRLAPVTCLLIVVSTVLLLNFDFTPDYNALISAIPDAEEVSLVQLLPL